MSGARQALGALALCAGFGACTEAGTAGAQGAGDAAQAAEAVVTSEWVVEMHTSKGDMTIELFPQDAPRTVENFLGLCRAGFYDGLPFHRSVPGFLVQAGDPDGDGAGGSGAVVPAEFNALRHRRGTLGMARLPDPDSASSQFYICHEEGGRHDIARLDGRYTVFGRLLDGFDTLDAIAAAGGAGGVPTETVTIASVTVRARRPDERSPRESPR